MRPSFVFILADDLGYADLGCYGGRADSSPLLDRMAREGTTWRNPSRRFRQTVNIPFTRAELAHPG
jgi:hypothetical protein